MQKNISINSYLESNNSFPSAYLRALSAIVSKNGTVNLAEFTTLIEIQNQFGSSALAEVMLLHTLEHPLSTSEAYKQLHEASEHIDPAIGKVAFENAKPLLLLQGQEGREIAGKLAAALRYQISEYELEAFSTSQNVSALKALANKAVKFFKGNGIADYAEECFIATGDPDLFDNIQAFKAGKIDENALKTQVARICQDASHQLVAYENKLASITDEEQVQNKLSETVHQLEHQVHQRLKIVEARIQHEQQIFAEDIEESIHNAGNAFELDVADRLKTDDWNKEKVWESIGRTSFGKELERRVDKIASRQERILNLLKEDLRLFQDDMKVNTTSILQRHHHTQFGRLLPPMKMKIRVINSVDNAANETLGFGALTLAGTGGLMYFLGTATVLPVIAPVLPFFGGGLVIAGIIKWFTDSDGRKDKEIRLKREALEEAMRVQLTLAKSSFEHHLDAIRNDFKKTADLTLEPLILEGQAIGMLYKMQKQVSGRLTSRAKNSLMAIERKVGELPG